MKISEHILLEDEHLVAVNKPAGMLTIPDREGNLSLKNHLQQSFGDIYTVHRLDRETSGVVVFARTEEAHRTLSQLFEGRDVEKYYLGLVLGIPEPSSGTIDIGIQEHPVKKGVMTVNRKGKPSVTDYETLDTFRLYSWMQFRIHTGRTHQIRVHMKHLGHPVVCDELYGDAKPIFVSSLKKNYNLARNEEAERPLLGRLGLHSWRLKFTLDGREYNFEAELPKDLKAVLNQLQKVKK